MNIDNALNFVRSLLFLAKTSENHNVVLDEETVRILYNELKKAKEDCKQCKQTMRH